MKQFGIIGIDPGKQGAFVRLTASTFEFWPMPHKEDGDLDFDAVVSLLGSLGGDCHVMLERAMPLAMGAKHAFNYGRNFMALELALKLSGLATTYVEPQKWSKVMHEGISSDLKPKAKSVIAVQRLFSQHLAAIPKTKTGKHHEGAIDALLIAGFGARKLKSPMTLSASDF
jgi:hypothetical protein